MSVVLGLGWPLLSLEAILTPTAGCLAAAQRRLHNDSLLGVEVKMKRQICLSLSYYEHPWGKGGVSIL